MRLYLDDDTVNALLVRLLKRAGYDVQLPSDAGRDGSSDPVQLQHSIRTNRVLLSGNHRDFEELHELIHQAGGNHPGILIVRRDNDSSSRLDASWYRHSHFALVGG